MQSTRTCYVVCCMSCVHCLVCRSDVCTCRLLLGHAIHMFFSMYNVLYMYTCTCMWTPFLQAFEREQLAVAKERMARITGSPPPPGLEGKVNQMNSRWQQIVSHTEERSVHMDYVQRHFVGASFSMSGKGLRLLDPLQQYLLSCIYGMGFNMFCQCTYTCQFCRF